jgi:hypothetical protein
VIKLVKSIVEKGIPTVLAALGAIILTFGFLDLSRDKDGWRFQSLDKPRSLPCLVGGVLLAMAAVMYWQENLAGTWVTRQKVRKTDTGYEVYLDESSHSPKIAVSFGRIEEYDLPNPKHGAVVFPVNEFFDRKCFTDEKTSLGAFVKKRIPSEAFSRLIAMVETKLKASNIQTKRIWKEPDVQDNSYGIGVCVALEYPVEIDGRVILVSSATKRAKEGVRCEVSFIFDAVKRVHETMADDQVDTILIPLLGPGKGGVRSELALFTMIVAFTEAARRPSGHHLKSVEIVIFRPSPESKPEISRSRAKRILGTASAMFG